MEVEQRPKLWADFPMLHLLLNKEQRQQRPEALLPQIIN
jgi:hypothetical protein